MKQIEVIEISDSDSDDQPKKRQKLEHNDDSPIIILGESRLTSLGDLYSTVIATRTFDGSKFYSNKLLNIPTDSNNDCLSIKDLLLGHEKGLAFISSCICNIYIHSSVHKTNK